MNLEALPTRRLVNALYVTLVRDSDGMTDWQERRDHVDRALARRTYNAPRPIAADPPDRATWGLLPEHQAAEAGLLGAVAN